MADNDKKSFPMLPVAHWWALRNKFKQSIPGTVTASYLSMVLDMQQNSARANVLPHWNLGRNTKKSIRKLKQLGDQSAHNRRYNAHREDIDKLQQDFRDVCQELLYLSKLK